MRWAVCVFAAVLAAFTAPSAHAQRDGVRESSDGLRWLVVPALGGDGGDGDESLGVERLHTAAEALRQELVMRGRSVWRADRASERFEVLGSAPAPTISQSDIDLWVERSRAAVRYLARADYKAARRELKAAQRLADRAAAELNREAARAQQVLDTCLFMVRAYVETKNDAEARKQARECRRLVPRVEPSAFRHTPEVRELLAEVDQEMASEAPGTLEVRSTPSDCVVRINGVEFGRTPLSGIELPVGTYRMQVECEEDKRGRIHRVGVSSGPNRLDFNAALDRAVRTRPVLHLQYDSHEAWSERLEQANEVGSVLGGAEVLVLSAQGAGSVRVDLSALKYEPASAWLAVRDGAPEAEDVRRVVDALLEGRSVDFTGPHPMARASWSAEMAPEVEVGAAAAAVVDAASKDERGVPRPRTQRIAGWSLFGVGVASMGASVGLHRRRGELGDRFSTSPSNLNAAQQWNDARIGVWATAAFGGAATSAAMPLLLPEYERTPWWGWTLGAVGLGLTGYAIYEGVTMAGCPEPYIADPSAVRSCVARGQEAGRLSLALAGAAPLLSIPLVYLLRPLRAEPSVSVTGEGAMLRVRKVFLMGAGGLRFGAVWLATMLAAPVLAQESESAPPRKSDALHRSRGSLVEGSVLVAPVQGTASLRAQNGARVAAAVRRGLEAHGYHASRSQELLGRALVACQTPECIEQALDAAGAMFAIVPAIWLRESGGQEVTLTLVKRSGRSLNATGVVGDDLAEVTVGLVEGLLARRAAAVAGTAAETETETETAAAAENGAGNEIVNVTGNGTAARRAGRGRPHAWKAGPIILIVGGAAAVVAIGVGAGVKGDHQQLDASAVAAWAAVGAAAIGGGIAWWVVGEKRRRKNGDLRSALAPELALHPTKIDLRLRF